MAFFLFGSVSPSHRQPLSNLFDIIILSVEDLPCTIGPLLTVYMPAKRYHIYRIVGRRYTVPIGLFVRNGPLWSRAQLRS